MTGTDISRWADKAMFEAAPIEGVRVELISATPDPLGAIAAACRMYEGTPTYSLTDITDDERRDFWEQVNSTHLKAPLEFVDLHFFIEGVTRALTHQMVRQRTAVYAQESLRFAVKENLAEETAHPHTIRHDPSLARVWDGAMGHIESAYKALIDRGVPAEDARGLLPHATTTRLHYKTNLRNMLEHAGNRLCTQAQFEWREVFIKIHEAMRTQVRERWQWEVITDSRVMAPVCYKLGHCPFMATFDRQCTIRERVNQGRFDEIDVKEWLADPTAGRRD